jgi:hypothetical protein
VILSAVAVGQWSEPVTLASNPAPYGAGPILVPHTGDSIWAFWIGEGMGPLQGRCLTADSWSSPELVIQGTEGVYWPAGITDDSGRVLVACYQGSYPVKSPAEQDSWGIYTTTRTDAGWSQPELAQWTMINEAFPTYVRLGKAKDGSVGMLWDENCGGINAMESVMVSRRLSTGWTPRCCIAPGRYPDVLCHSGSLVPGDSTDCLVAFSRWTAPDSSEVEVWDMNDSLVGTPAVFSGGLPALARGQDVRFLVFAHGDTLMAAENRGAGWGEPVVIATGIGWGGAALRVDPLGWAWACWPDSFQQSVLASYNRGAGWSLPEMVVTSGALGSPRIASDGLGNLHCVWFDHTGGVGTLRHAHRLGRPGVEERVNGEERREKVAASVIRSLPAGAVVFDAMGRRVLNPKPGIYFVTEHGARCTAHVRKVVIQR